MGKRLFNENQSRSLMEGFLDEIWKKRKEHSSPEEMEGLNAFLGGSIGDPAFWEDWRDCYTFAFGKPFTDETRLTEEEVFTTMISFISWYLFKWEQNIFDLLNLVFIMRYRPEEAQEEWAMWQKVMQELQQ